MIDLVCYRRHGHNEADEPSATQPVMYQKIKKHPTPRKIYADVLTEQKVASLEDATEMVNLYRDALDRGDCVVEEWRPMNLHSFTWSPYLNHEWDEEYPSKVEMKRLQELARRISTVPEAIEMQSRVAKIYADRAEMAAGNKPFDWGAAETLAYATMADEGIQSASPAKTPAAVPSSTVTQWCTTRKTVPSTFRWRTSTAAVANSRSGTPCCPKKRCWRSNTATRQRNRAR